MRAWGKVKSRNAAGRFRCHLDSWDEGLGKAKSRHVAGRFRCGLDSWNEGLGGG